MALNVLNTKSSASMKLLKDEDHTVSVPISGLIPTPDRNKLWAIVKKLNELQEFELSKLILSETVSISEG